MAVRVVCDTPGLEANWVEVDEVWTRKELQAFVTLEGDEYWELWARKVVACHIELPSGEVITAPERVRTALDDLDLRLLRWLSTAVLTATQYLLNLGEGSARLSLNGVGVAAPAKIPTTTR